LYRYCAAERLGLETACTPTGVKHLHPRAEEFDGVGGGVYKFESS
jgi:phosphomannomutase